MQNDIIIEETFAYNEDCRTITTEVWTIWKCKKYWQLFHANFFSRLSTWKLSRWFCKFFFAVKMKGLAIILKGSSKPFLIIHCGIKAIGRLLWAHPVVVRWTSRSFINGSKSSYPQAFTRSFSFCEAVSLTQQWLKTRVRAAYEDFPMLYNTVLISHIISYRSGSSRLYSLFPSCFQETSEYGNLQALHWLNLDYSHDPWFK